MLMKIKKLFEACGFVMHLTQTDRKESGEHLQSSLKNHNSNLKNGSYISLVDKRFCA
jgi:hypothetical protein